MKLGLLTNATVIDDANRFVSTNDNLSKADSVEKDIKYELNSNIFCKINVSTYR
jgi:hypothetical protein